MPVAPITHTHIWPIFRKPSACIEGDWLCSCFLVLRSSLQPNIVSLMGCDENTNGLEPGRCVPWQTDCCLTNEWENVCCWELDRWAVVRQDLRSQRLGSAWDERVVPAGPFPPPASTYRPTAGLWSPPLLSDTCGKHGWAAQRHYGLVNSFGTSYRLKS